jgi:hypothetical protein
MTSVFVGFAAAALAAGIILVRRQYSDRSVEEMIAALAKINAATRDALNSLELSREPAPNVVQTKRDLIIIWWNSRLFLTISRKAALTVESTEAKITAEYIAERHKRVLNLLPVALLERAMRSNFHEYQSQLAVCYEEEVRSLELLMDRPQTELLRARA